MDKEQKKLLLVAVSVGVFLLVTITVAIILLTPKANAQENANFPPPVPAIIQPVMPPLQPQVDNSPVTNNNTNSEKPESAAADRNGTVIVEPPTKAGVPLVNPDITPSPQPRPVVTIAPAKPAETPAPAAQPVVSRPVTATRQTTPARTTYDYWIQTGAYSSIVRAEDAKELLSSKGFTSIIETRVIDSRNLYRVRLGPYTSEREANYWLTLVKVIDGFSDSQIRQTTRQQ